MKYNKKRLRKQLILLSFLFVTCILSSSIIFLGATVFRSQLPFFQLIDGEVLADIQLQPAPSPNPGVVSFESQSAVNLYLILGSDYRPESGFRTDTILLAAVDSRSGKASVVSFPRDLWVSIPGFGEGRINTVMQKGGFPLLTNTLQTNFETGVESNINPDDLLPLVRVGLGFNLDDVRWYVVGSDVVTSWTTAEGAAVLLPDTPAIQAILQEALTFD